MTALTARLPKMDYQRTQGRIRLRHPSGKYLHLSGEGLTLGTEHAWNGTKAQARTLRDRALVAGEEWAFRAVKKCEATE
ncbi:hypothetical protein PL335_06195 [Sulfitobacter faviae]|uniref:hypothetical protein n=1 Tax=Sulfitobacter faviae TaxID=1775881 RepID=UPI002307777C|nr:hypothetical protein [Sulfitobacter faviae]WCE67933.1 hypothetical protein PL335_06195 [Sulfitobacter faviae]